MQGPVAAWNSLTSYFTKTDSMETNNPLKKTLTPEEQEAQKKTRLEQAKNLPADQPYRNLAKATGPAATKGSYTATLDPNKELPPTEEGK
jgi:hypothetical protein